MTGEIELSGLDGTNPLGFLAALGTLVTLGNAGEKEARLSWKRRGTWVPVIGEVSAPTRERVSAIVARGLEGDNIPEDAEQRRVEAQKRFEHSRQEADRKKKEVGKRGLTKSDREAAIEAEVVPLDRARDSARDEWLRALAEAVPRPELALGKKVDCTPAEYRDHARTFRDCAAREALNLLAAFGTDACLEERAHTIQATPFCFINGSGQQFFLDTARQLIEKVSVERVERALFEAWTYDDEKLSMRWDPIEDRRYALMDRDPSEQEARTVWMANLLAYEALALFPCAPRSGRLRATGWTVLDRKPAFTWPLWEFPANGDTVRSLLQLQELKEPDPDRALLRARGVAAVFRSRRVKVGTGGKAKFNFSPARAVV
jgi:CRISPR-associated endonuclease/helicase Cas3